MKVYGWAKECAALTTASCSVCRVVSVKVQLINSVVAVTYNSSHVYRYDTLNQRGSDQLVRGLITIVTVLKKSNISQQVFIS